MISIPIFKQALRSNSKLWLILTVVASVLLAFFSATYDGSGFGALASAAEGTTFGGIFSSMGTFMGSFENYYKMLAVLLGLVYVVFTANNLVVDEVDSGSMAYTLSTPIKRSTVIITKLVFLIGSIAVMFGIITAVGIGTAEIANNSVFGNPITTDVKKAAKVLDQKPRYVNKHLYVILDNDYAINAGADARSMDDESYRMYIEETMLRNSYQSAAKKLTEEREKKYKNSSKSRSYIEITQKELEKDPSLALNSNDALKAGSFEMGISVDEYRNKLQSIVNQNKDNENNENTEDMTSTFSIAMSAAAKELKTTTTKLSTDLTLMKKKEALDAATTVTGLPAEQLTVMINQAIIQNALTEDENAEFDMETFLWLNLGCALLILALSSIAFFASAVFNRSKHALAVGSGLPFAFYLLSVVEQMGDSFENVKYLTITTFYDTSEILSKGDFGVGLTILGIITIVLYGSGSFIFCKKDLPL
ncbi:TPA: ABC transporter permease subunit [Listeria monocytogenes]